MNKFLKIILNGYSLVILILLAGFASAVYAMSLDGVTFPVAELGNCQNQEECAIFCDTPDNMEACIAYGASKGLISKEEEGIAKKAVVRIKAGTTPGGCKDRESCTNYCQNNISDLNNCIGFAEEIGVPADEIAQAKKIAKALEKGALLPGNCQGKGACEAYCKNANHIDECLLFAEAAEILPAEELAEAKKIAKFIKNGETPGGCQAKDECKSYCDKDENFEECINFAQKAELVSEEEFTIAKKTGGKGPGNCKSKKACEEYCNEPENAELCANFAVEKGILSEEETDNIINGVARIKDGLATVPPEIKGDVESCLNNLMGGNLSGVLAGSQRLTQNQGNSVGACFEDAAKKYAEQASGAMSCGSAGGPNGAPAGKAPEMKDIKTAPKEVQEKVNQEIEERKQTEMEKNKPKDIPVNISPSGGGATGGPVPAPSGPDCSAFASVPSCEMVSGDAEDFCKKCFPNK
jgi:hypothetical protein